MISSAIARFTATPMTCSKSAKRWVGAHRLCRPFGQLHDRLAGFNPQARTFLEAHSHRPSPCYVNQPPDYVGGFERSDIEELLDMMEKNYIGWASFFAPTVMQNADQPELSEELEGSFCSTDPNTALRFARTTFYSDNRAALPKVTVPSLIMQCAEDIIAPLEVGQYVHRHLPQSTLQIMEATGHCPHLSHPAETIEVMRHYLHAVQDA